MYYKYSRRIQLNKFLGKDFSFESAEFGVDGAESRKEAIEEVSSWIKEEIDRLKKEIEKKKEPDNSVPFETIIKNNPTILKKPNKK